MDSLEDDACREAAQVTTLEEQLCQATTAAATADPDQTESAEVIHLWADIVRLEGSSMVDLVNVHAGINGFADLALSASILARTVGTGTS